MMKKVLKIVSLLILLTACFGGEKKKDEGNNFKDAPKVSYDTYCNMRYDYCVDYPDFLIPQGEATNQDGQRFLSEDGMNQMMVFYSYKMDDKGELLDLMNAYIYDREQTDSRKFELHENHYLLSYEKDNKLVRYMSVKAYDAFITIIIEFDKDDVELLETVLSHVSESLNIAAPISSEPDAKLINFLEDCWWEVNFNSLLQNKSENLMSYINQEFGLRRIHSPGTIPILSGKDENYGFTEYDNFSYKPVSGGEYILERIKEDINICSVEASNVIYYSEDMELPHVVINRETFESVQVDNPWDDAEIISLYVFNENNSPRAFYFALLPYGDFYLLYFDDSLCQA